MCDDAREQVYDLFNTQLNTILLMICSGIENDYEYFIYLFV